MPINSKLVLLVSILLFLVSCASKDRKKAEFYMEKDQFELAHPFWSKVLASDPDDGEAKLAKKKCEYEILNIKLVRLRDLLISKNTVDALDVAREIREKRKTWGSDLDYNLAKFELNEIKKLYRSFELLIDKQLKAKKVIYSLNIFVKNRHLFTGIKSDLDAIKKKIDETGISKCNELKKSIGANSFYNLFTVKYCHVFGQEIANIDKYPNYANDLYFHLNTSVLIDRLSDESNYFFKDQIIDKFKKSPWFHPEGKKTADIMVTGKYKFNNIIKPARKIHVYFVDIPYEAYELVKQERDNAYQTQEYQCDASGSKCGPVEVTKYRKEFYTESKLVTKYRKESRSIEYDAIHINSNFYMALNGPVKLNGQKVSVTYLDELKENDFESSVSMPSIGLKAHKAKTTNEIEWIKIQADKFANVAKDYLTNNWSEKFCDINPKKLSKVKYIDYVIRCQRSKGESYPFVSDWFFNETGVDGKLALEYIKL